MKCNKKNSTFVAGFSFLSPSLSHFFFKDWKNKTMCYQKKKKKSSTKITNAHGQEIHLNFQIVLGKPNLVGTKM